MKTTPIIRIARLTAIFAGVAVTAACNDFLKATNPGAIDEPNLADSTYINLMVNGVIGEFQPALNNATFWSAKFTDELRNHHVFAEEVDFDLRAVAPTSGTYSGFVYNPLQRTRFLGDSVASRVKKLLPDSAGLSLRIARSLAYGAYAYNLLGEMVCGVPYNLSATLPADSSFARARARFTEARTIATAFRATLPTPLAATNPADSMINFANVGIARASMGLGDWAAAEAAAALVTNTAFDQRAYYHSNSTIQTNRFFINASSGSTANNAIALTPFYQVSPDPRIPYPATTEGTQNGQQARVPNSPRGWSTYTGTLPGGEFAEISHVTIASYLEAQHMLFEARLRQNTTTGVLAFINSRRAAGGQAPVVLVTVADMLTELRDQRRRDFALTGHRLGDMRRYLKRDNVNFYETGPYPGSTTGVTFGTQVCFPLPTSELGGNPQASQPNTSTP